MIRIWNICLFIFTVFLCSIQSESISCQSMRGRKSWFLMLKPPKSTALLYADDSKPYLIHHDVQIDSWSNPVAMTMLPIYNPKWNSSVQGSLNYFMFNDAVPEGATSFVNGHTKGVVMFDEGSLVPKGNCALLDN